MIDREKVIKGLEELSGFLFKEYGKAQAEEASLYYDRFLTVDNAIALLKEQEEERLEWIGAVAKLTAENELLKEQFIEAFNTIRDAYNVPENREKILLNYLMRNACCCADGERKEGR